MSVSVTVPGPPIEDLGSALESMPIDPELLHVVQVLRAVRRLPGGEF